MGDNFIHQGILGCSCHKEMHWNERYDEFKTKCDKRNVDLNTSREEWEQEANSCKFKPKLTCRECKSRVTSTTINSFITHGTLGCSCHKERPWIERYDEFRTKCDERNVDLNTSREEWEQEAT